jgi:hypothetical protein
MNEQQQWEQDTLDRRLAEQELFQQTLEAKTDRLKELEAEVAYLRRTLNDVLAAPRPAYAPAPARTTVPRRWQVAA